MQHVSLLRRGLDMRREGLGYAGRLGEELADAGNDKLLEVAGWDAQPIWGIGPYALSHILVLLGDYRTIPVDSEILKYLSKTHFDGRKVSPTRAVEPYEHFGPYRFLAFKFGRMSRRENYIN